MRWRKKWAKCKEKEQNRSLNSMNTSAYLGFPHGHVSSLSVAGQTLNDPPHSLSWSNPLHKVGREEANSVATLALKSTEQRGISAAVSSSILNRNGKLQTKWDRQHTSSLFCLCRDESLWLQCTNNWGRRHTGITPIKVIFVWNPNKKLLHLNVIFVSRVFKKKQ